MARLGKSLPPKLEAATCPDRVVHLWRWFIEILPGCAGGLGPSSIRWVDLEAWGRITGRQLERWEIAALFRLSGTYARVRAEETKSG